MKNLLERNPYHEPHEYLHIRAWGKMMGSYEYYISTQQALAANEHAPLTAIYERNGHWHTFESIVNPSTKAYISQIVKELEKRAR